MNSNERKRMPKKICDHSISAISPQGHDMESIDTLLDYKKCGIPLMPCQLKFLSDNGYW